MLLKNTLPKLVTFYHIQLMYHLKLLHLNHVLLLRKLNKQTRKLLLSNKVFQSQNHGANLKLLQQLTMLLMMPLPVLIPLREKLPMPLSMVLLTLLLQKPLLMLLLLPIKRQRLMYLRLELKLQLKLSLLQRRSSLPRRMIKKQIKQHQPIKNSSKQRLKKQ